MHQPLCIDYPNVTSGIHELSAKTYIKWINRTSHSHHRYPIARHTSSVLKSNTQSNITKPQGARLNSSQQEIEREETPYDPTIITKLVVHQDRAKSRTREREIKHIATGTYPQPRGWTTPSSSWRPPGWWRWPPVMVSPSDRVPERAPDWFFVATEACGGGTPDLGLFLEVLVFIGGVRIGDKSRGSTRRRQGRGARPRGRPPPLWLPQESSPISFRSSIFYIFQKYSP
jgi:hypothetical protein